MSENEPNDTQATAELLPAGFDAGEVTSIGVTGALADTASSDVAAAAPGDVVSGCEP